MTQFYIGQSMLHSDQANYRIGHIAEIKDIWLVVVWDTDKIDNKFHVSMAQRFIDAASAANIPAKSPNEMADYYSKVSNIVAGIERQAKQQRLDDKAARDKFLADIKLLVPSDTKAVIYATQQTNNSDSNSDHFDHKNGQIILLAWSKHTRDIFSEMRKAAKNHPDTTHLADESSIEHREKYSMGGGYYLSSSQSQHADGWVIRKRRLIGFRSDNEFKLDEIPSGINSIPK